MVQQPTTSKPPRNSGERGQALIEYALILVLVVMAMVAAVAATGPALGNVFSNTVFNLIGINTTPQNIYAMGGPTAFWQTVTAVALNPPDARVFPTAQILPTLTPTNGPSPTATPITPTATFTASATIPPTPTATDAAFNLPHVDPIDQPVWWRVDNTVYLGGAEWKGEYYPNANFTEPADRTFYNSVLGSEYRFAVDFNWGAGAPISGWTTVDNFSVRFTRIIDAGTTPVALNFILDSNDYARLKIDGVTAIDYWNVHSMGSPKTTTQTLSGIHTLVVEYADGTGDAAVKLDITGNQGHTPADANKGTGAANCPWTRITGTQPNTISWAWKENVASITNGFPQNMRCNLELRGFVDLNGVANPTFSFWDVWDFGSAADTTIKLQLAEYTAYNDNLSGGPNWAGGASYTLHSSGKNYAWTRTELPIPAGLLNKKVTWRFVMESGTTTSIRRWYVDDIRLAAGATKTFGVCSVNKYTCGSFWSLDVPDQAQDFITSGRWVLSNKIVASNDSGGPSLSWDVSNGSNGNSNRYVTFGSEQTSADYRIHYVALNGTVNLTAIAANGGGGTPDWEGDSGYPILSFYQAFGLERGDTIEVQYTRDIDAPGTPSNWQRVGLNAIRTVPTSGSAVTATMSKFELQLKDIPNWNTQPFRLRFALIVSNSNESTGWFIDNIAIEREGILRYANYPFCDDAEGEDVTESWLMGGQWGIATTTGAFGTGRSFSDSPVGNYIHGQVTSMTMRYPIDLNNDSPENLTNWGGNKSCFDGSNTAPAVRPILSFWHWRRLASSDSFRIELYRPAKSPTTLIGPVAQWNYTYNATNSTQYVWERQELDLRAAVEKATGVSWTTLMSNADKYDDDFFLIFTFDGSTNSSVSDGIYIDNILIQEYSETSYKLWPTNRSYTARTGAPVAGNGTGTNWVDNIDSPVDWYNRWTAGGEWDGVTWDAHSGITSMHDSNGSATTKYLHQSFNVLEMNTILDLRGTNTTDLPTLYFWNHYSVGRGDSISVDVAVQDEVEMTTASPPRNLTGYEYRYLFGSATSYGNSTSWQSIWSEPANSRNDAWVREQVDLRNFVGKRLKVRFVLNAYSDSSNLGMGWWLDDIQFTFRTSEVFTVGNFNDPAQNMRYWIPEGRWGLAPDQWRGSGGGPAELGNNAWTVWWFDCINWLKNYTQNGPNANYLNQESCSESNWNNFFNYVGRTVTATDAWITPKANLATNKLVAGTHYVKTFTDVVKNEFGEDGRPDPRSNTWYDQYGARMIRPITVTGGEYSFIANSDDGIRVRVENADGSTPAGFTSSPFWNIVNNWSFHSLAVNVATVTLQPGNYNIILEWFEGTGGATVNLSVGTNKFSFSDSPKAGAGGTFPVVKSIPYSDSSLILNGVFNLNMPAGYTTAQWQPRIEYYALYFFDSNSYGAVEVSADGGFTWTQSGLADNCPAALNSAQCNPTTWGYVNYTPANGGAWVLRSHNLSSYVNQNIGLRFKMHTDSSTQDGWWITDIFLANSGT
ncbi:MAG: hypothetical protein LCI00_05075 [Chloroflexi bacterium]|nr:hypothetical protein [Chloroflexota bacterium]